MESQNNQQPSNAALLFQPPLSKKTYSLPPIEQRGKAINEEIHPDDVEILNDTQSGKLLNLNKDSYSEQEVPIVKITKKNSKVNLVFKSKNKQEVPYETIARGILVDFNKDNKSLKGQIDFIGNFKGVFEKEITQTQVILYFEGEITNLKILKINGLQLSVKKRQQIADLTHLKGYFKGSFIPTKYLNSQNTHNQNLQYQLRYLPDKLIQESASKVQYHVPAMVRMDIRKITQINLQKSSAEIAAALKIDIQLNQEVLDLLYDKQEECFNKKYKLNIDCHRGKPFVLPFYDPSNFQETDQQQQYEWDDVWQGIDLQYEWKAQLMRMSYRIKTTFTAQIDNSHGIFYAPFNLNILKIIIDFHSIKVDSKTKICINCCELTDFNSNIPYTPYTFFHNLQRDLQDKTDHEKIYKKHIDRLNKIDTTQFVDQGEFKVANNRLSLFPYHKRVFKNKNNIASDLYWTIGFADKDSLFQIPLVQSIKQSYQLHLNYGQQNIFQLDQWQFIHIQIPIFKYPVIDIIRIFVPITILSAISLTIFWQENARDYSGFTELAKRIASGCSLMIAYVALIPMIRGNLPPTPSITLVQILIYLSVIPNFLAILSTLITTSGDTNQFFNTYNAFIDPLFLVSFIICCVSMIVLTIMIIAYAKKDYKSDFTIYKFKSSPLNNMRAPTFLEYIEKINKIRRQYSIEKLKIPYRRMEEYQEEQD